ncbi:MAG TPA: GyrI-like domain-containing protein [Panacibacter sp.]|nr:GyrI-like domain-containing protein [Panacibacter sp.]HNP42902.1 GyrI-like domain-containing protein [Panacibacter sp.]
MTNGFNIIGISTRTTNRNNRAQQDLGELWGQFYADNIFDKIPNKVSDNIVAIYTDYESDFTGEYTTLIGVPVSTLDNIPKGLTGRTFTAENFRKFAAKGAMPHAVINTWSDIWQNDKVLNRKYSYDFEVYGQQSQMGADAEVYIFISVK